MAPRKASPALVLACRQQIAAEAGLRALREARDLFKRSGNKQTLARVRAAISSAKGALRVCEYRITRAGRD